MSALYLPTCQTNSRGLHFLIVDDDEGDRRQINRAICHSISSSSCTETATLLEALAACDKSSFDCALVDYRLPGEDGLDAISALRERFPFLPIVMSTGQGDEMVAIEAMKRGASDYIPKSKIDADSIRKVIENGLRWATQETESAKSRSRLQSLGLNDPLTGLPNRTLFTDRLDQLVLLSQRNGEAFTVMMMDLNLFKEINDRLGHHCGDDALCQVARRLCSVVRKTDTVARLGGDEFACLLPMTKSLTNAELVAEKIVDIIREPMLIDQEPVTLGISIGIAHCPLHGLDSPSLLQRADKAMYEAKKNCTGIQVFQSGPDQNDSDLLAGDLMQAIASRELMVYFQPQVHLGSRQIVGKEALVRWQHPQQGMITPHRFIPAAEKSSAAITALTDAVLQMALDQEQAWRGCGFCVPVSVNLSAPLLQDESLPGRILEMLSDRKLPPESLILEMTEMALAASAQAPASATLRRLSDAGIRISIDDFGAGYTSFKQLRELEIAEIKIAGTYVAEVCEQRRNASIVRSILELGRGFDVPVIAVGVEQQSSWQTLIALGCNLAQGYSIGRPMDPSTFDHWRDEWLA